MFTEPPNDAPKEGLLEIWARGTQKSMPPVAPFFIAGHVVRRNTRRKVSQAITMITHQTTTVVNTPTALGAWMPSASSLALTKKPGRKTR